MSTHFVSRERPHTVGGSRYGSYTSSLTANPAGLTDSFSRSQQPWESSFAQILNRTRQNLDKITAVQLNGSGSTTSAAWEVNRYHDSSAAAIDSSIAPPMQSSTENNELSRQLAALGSRLDQIESLERDRQLKTERLSSSEAALERAIQKVSTMMMYIKLHVAHLRILCCLSLLWYSWMPSTMRCEIYSEQLLTRASWSADRPQRWMRRNWS